MVRKYIEIRQQKKDFTQDVSDLIKSLSKLGAKAFWEKGEHDDELREKAVLNIEYEGNFIDVFSTITNNGYNIIRDWSVEQK